MGEFGGKVLPPNLKPFIKSINMLFYIVNGNPNTVHVKTVVEANNPVSFDKLLWDSQQNNIFLNLLHISQNIVL